MKNNILQFRLKAKPSRDNAKNWLSNNLTEWPNSMINDIGDNIFHGWRFIRSTDGIVYFANCIDMGIREEDIFNINNALFV